jgi:hypothetical protein
MTQERDTPVGSEMHMMVAKMISISSFPSIEGHQTTATNKLNYTRTNGFTTERIGKKTYIRNIGERLESNRMINVTQTETELSDNTSNIGSGLEKA